MQDLEQMDDETRLNGRRQRAVQVRLGNRRNEHREDYEAKPTTKTSPKSNPNSESALTTTPKLTQELDPNQVNTPEEEDEEKEEDTITVNH